MPSSPSPAVLDDLSSCVVFVGNLSYFCEEPHLHKLFDNVGHVTHVRIVRNESNSRSLMYGFVTLSSFPEAQEIERLLNNHLFMGRRLRVAIADQKENNRSQQSSSAAQGTKVHISFCSYFPTNNLLKPTEAFLLKAFIMYGRILDVTVKDYAVYRDQNLQEGYGFVTMASYDDALKVVSNVQNMCIDGIVLTCQLTHQHNQSMMKMKEVPSNPMSLPSPPPSLVPLLIMPHTSGHHQPYPLNDGSVHFSGAPIQTPIPMVHGGVASSGYAAIPTQPVYYIPINNPSIPPSPPSDHKHYPLEYHTMKNHF